MKKIGSVTAVIGLIYIGLWLIVGRFNVQASNNIIKWWPIIITILGIEFLVYNSISLKKRAKLNLLVIPIFIVFLCINLWNGDYTYSWDNKKILSILKLNDFSSININECKIINANTVIDYDIENLLLYINKGNIIIHRAKTDKIKMICKIYVDKSSPIKKYNIFSFKNYDQCIVEMKEPYIKRIDTELYIPDKGQLSINSDSTNIISYDKFVNTGYTIDTNNSNIKLLGGIKLLMNLNAGMIDLKDIKDVQIKGNSSTININGETQNIEANLDSGIINIDNNICKNVQLTMNEGRIRMNTDDKNVNVSTSLDTGICTINGDRRTNAGFSKVMGSGLDNVDVKLLSGTIDFSSKE